MTSQEPKKKGIPSLNVKGLTFSSLVQENGKTQEENDVANLVKQQSSAQEPPPLEKKKSFVPSLKVQGLGLSTLQKENGKT